jgi:hypothetical protein
MDCGSVTLKRDVGVAVQKDFLDSTRFDLRDPFALRKV